VDAVRVIQSSSYFLSLYLRGGFERVVDDFEAGRRAVGALWRGRRRVEEEGRERREGVLGMEVVG